MSEPLPPPPIDPSVGTPTAASDPSPPPPPPVASMHPWIARVNGSFPTLGHVSDQLSFVLRDTGKTDLEADCYSAHVIGSFATFDTRAGNYVIHTLPTPLDSRYSFADLRSRLARRDTDGALLNVSWEDGLTYCIRDTFKDHLSLDTIQPDRGVFTATVNNDDMWGWKSSEGTPQMLVTAGMVADKIVSLSSEAEEEEPLKGTITFHDGNSTTTLDFVFDDITEKTLDELEKTYEARHAYKSALGEESGGGGQSVDAETEVPV